MDSFRKATRQFQIRRRGFTPNQVSIRRIRQATADCLLNACMSTEEAFVGALAGNKFAVIRVAIGGDQIRRIGIGTSHQQGWNARNVGSQTRRNQFLDCFLSWHQYFTAHMTAFFHGRQLIFEVNCRCTGFNHRFHQFKGIQDTAKTGFRIGNDRQEVIDIARIARLNARGPLDLIGTTEGVVDPLHHSWHRVCRIERLIRIHAGRQVSVRRYLPSRQIDCFNTRFRLLQRLTASQCTEAVDVAFFRLTVQQSPHFRRTQLCQRAFRID